MPNYHLYHALIEALIANEYAMDKEVAVKVKDHKRKHNSNEEEDDDDDEGPSAGSNQGRSAKRRRPESAASRSAQPPKKDDEHSSKKPRKSDASASKQHPTLPFTRWKIIDTRDADVDSSMHRSDPESEQSEQSSDNIPMQDEGHVSDLEDTDNTHIPKARDLLHLNQNGPFPRMISQNQRITGQICTPQRIKFLRRTSFKGRHMILGHSSNGSADEQERRSSAKLI
ncbi:hypothetical protein Tco_1496977 [Tanacetum coccineum]